MVEILQNSIPTLLSASKVKIIDLEFCRIERFGQSFIKTWLYNVTMDSVNANTRLILEENIHEKF